MSSFNKVILLGNLTRDPALNYTPSQTAVCDIGLATNRKWTDQSGQQREEVCFVDCRAFGKTAENLNKYMKKGSSVLVEGRLCFDQWTGQDGVKRSKHRVTIESVQFMSSGQRQSAPPAGGNYEDAPGEPTSHAGYPLPGEVSGPPRGTVPDDEIPFD